LGESEDEGPERLLHVAVAAKLGDAGVARQVEELLAQEEDGCLEQQECSVLVQVECHMPARSEHLEQR
jgi:hypothetical protein